MATVFPIIPASGKAFWFLGGIILLLFLILCLLGYTAYSLQHVTFEINPHQLRIKGGLYGRTVPASALVVDQAQSLDLTQQQAYRPKWRTNGIGLPGYAAGWFKLRNREKALLFVTDGRRVVYIPTRQGYVLILSVAAPEQFLQTLQRSIKRMN